MKTVTDLFEKYIGVKEYNGIVRTMIEWFYDGAFAKVSWCAISMSYMLNKLGLLAKIGQKQDNCYYLLKEFEKADKNGIGKLYMKNKIPKNYTIKRGTVILILKSDPPMTYDSAKHVTSAYKDFTYKGSGYFSSLGGNQSDYIKESQYPQKQIYAIYEPPYEEEEAPKVRDLKYGCTGEDVKKLQKQLNDLGYTDQYDLPLLIDGKFKARTRAAVKKLQKAQGLKVDGIVGKITRAKIKELENGFFGEAVHPTTRLNCRRGAGATYAIKIVLGTSYVDTVDKVKGNWVHLKIANGWVNKKYLAIADQMC